MKILVLGRLFSGLADGLSKSVWTPSGVPAFYKLVEALASDPSINQRVILFCKDPDPRFRHAKPIYDQKIGRIDVIPWRAITGGRVRKLDRLATEFDHLLRAIWAGITGGYALVYATYGLIIPAAVLSRVLRQKVVLRLMGIFPHHREIADGNHRLFRWAMQAPYAAVICTEDGSDPSEILPRIVSPGTPVTVRLNGCDAKPAKLSNSRRNGPLTVLYLGRLEPYKGADIFVEAAVAHTGANLRFEVIGDGSMRTSLEERAARARTEIVFHGTLPHAAVTEALQAADIYVSANLHGNLSNANLEAMAAGCAMVLPSPDHRTPIDLSTERLIPADAAVRYDRANAVPSLTNALSQLGKNQVEVERLRSRALDLAKSLLCPWTERIEADKETLWRLAAGSPPKTKAS